LDGLLQFDHRERLAQVVAAAPPEDLLNEALGPVGRHEDHGNGGIALLEVGEKDEAREPRQPKIQEHEVHRMFVEHLEGLDPRARGQHIVLGAEDGLNGFDQGIMVVQHQDAGTPAHG
jgi:hypothetical protein